MRKRVTTANKVYQTAGRCPISGEGDVGTSRKLRTLSIALEGRMEGITTHRGTGYAIPRQVTARRDGSNAEAMGMVLAAVGTHPATALTSFGMTDGRTTQL